MSKKLFTGRSYSDIWLAAAGFISFVTFFFTLASLLPPVATDKLVIWGGALVVSVSFFGARLVQIARSRWWLSATDSGFVVANIWGERTVTDAEVADISFVEGAVSDKADRETLRAACLTIVTGERIDVIEFEQRLSPDQPDELGSALRRALAALVASWHQRLEAGHRLIGDGWALRRDGLELTGADGSRSYRLDEIDAVEPVYAEMWVWAGGQSEPVLKLRATEPFAILLFKLLTELRGGTLAAPETVRADTPGETSDARTDAASSSIGVPGATEPGLGRLLFSRDQTLEPHAYSNRQAVAVGFILLGSVPFASGAWLGFETYPARTRAVVGLLIVVAALRAAVACWRNQRTAFRCYVHGVVHKTWKGTTTLMYRDVGSFTDAGTRLMLEGTAYMGTEFTMVFEPLDPTTGPPIRYHGSFNFTDEHLEGLRDFISRVIAGHMLRRLEAGERVLWTPQLAFTPTGLSVQRVEKDGTAAVMRVVPYDQLGDYELKDGVFYLTAKDGFGRPITDPVSQPNFFPGFYLYLLLTRPDEAVVAEPAPFSVK